MSNTRAQRARRIKRDNRKKALTLVAYRRKRRDLIKKIILAVVTIGLLITVSIAACNNRPNYDFSETDTYRVESGDTLWTIANQYYDNSHDIRKVIGIIEEINETSALIYPGDILEIPIFEDN